MSEVAGQPGTWWRPWITRPLWWRPLWRAVASFEAGASASASPSERAVVQPSWVPSSRWAARGPALPMLAAEHAPRSGACTKRQNVSPRVVSRSRAPRPCGPSSRWCRVPRGWGPCRVGRSRPRSASGSSYLRALPPVSASQEVGETSRVVSWFARRSSFLCLVLGQRSPEPGSGSPKAWRSDWVKRTSRGRARRQLARGQRPVLRL